MPKILIYLSMIILLFVGCHSVTELEKSSQTYATKTINTPNGPKDIYDPAQDKTVLAAFEFLHNLSPTELKFEPSEFIFFENQNISPLRSAYSVMYKATHRQRLSLAPYCPHIIIDSDCNQWWNVKHCDGSKPNCKVEIIPASAGSRNSCSIQDKRTWVNSIHPIGEHFFRKANGFAFDKDAPSKAEQLENFFRIECAQ